MLTPATALPGSTRGLSPGVRVPAQGSARRMFRPAAHSCRPEVSPVVPTSQMSPQQLAAFPRPSPVSGRAGVSAPLCLPALRPLLRGQGRRPTGAVGAEEAPCSSRASTFDPERQTGQQGCPRWGAEGGLSEGTEAGRIRVGTQAVRVHQARPLSSRARQGQGCEAGDEGPTMPRSATHTDLRPSRGLWWIPHPGWLLLGLSDSSLLLL